LSRASKLREIQRIEATYSQVTTQSDPHTSWPFCPLASDRLAVTGLPSSSLPATPRPYNRLHRITSHLGARLHYPRRPTTRRVATRTCAIPSLPRSDLVCLDCWLNTVTHHRLCLTSHPSRRCRAQSHLKRLLLAFPSKTSMILPQARAVTHQTYFLVSTAE
jgi:hypothetical protein